MATRKESAADITVSVGNESEVVVERLTLDKNIDVSTIRGSGKTVPDSYSIDGISYQGTMELQGNKLELEDVLFDRNGVPKEATITVTHFDETTTTFYEVIATTAGYEMSAGETTTTNFEFMAMGRSRDDQVDSNN